MTVDLMQGQEKALDQPKRERISSSASPFGDWFLHSKESDVGLFVKQKIYFPIYVMKLRWSVIVTQSAMYSVFV